jgi:hypothetical protein
MIDFLIKENNIAPLLSFGGTNPKLCSNFKWRSAELCVVHLLWASDLDAGPRLMTPVGLILEHRCSNEASTPRHDSKCSRRPDFLARVRCGAGSRQSSMDFLRRFCVWLKGGVDHQLVPRFRRPREIGARNERAHRAPSPCQGRRAMSATE